MNHTEKEMERGDYEYTCRKDLELEKPRKPAKSPKLAEPYGQHAVTRPNFEGKPQTLRYRGTILATCGDVELIKDGKYYAVRYGLQLKANMTRNAAAYEFGFCVLHQAQLEGRLS